MTSSSPAPSRRPRLLLAAPLALALSLSWGCARSAPAHEPAAPAMDNPSAAAAAAQRPDALMTPVTPDTTPPAVAATEPAPTRAATPRREARPAPRRDATLASPEIVGAGTVDRGDLSEALVPAPSPRASVLEQREIDGQFEQSEGRLQACFRGNRAPTGSEVIVGFVIGPDGHVTSVWPVGSKVSVSVTQCILQTVNGFQFRATSNGTTRATSTIRYE